MERFIVLKRAIQVLHFLLRNPLDIFCSLTTEMWLKRTCHCLRITEMAIFILLSRSIRAYECAHTHMGVINVFRTRDTKHYIRRSFWDECRRVSHRPTNWCAFLLIRCVLLFYGASAATFSDWLHCISGLMECANLFHVQMTELL